MFMNEHELNAIVDARLAEELAARHEADRRRVKMQVVDQIRRAAEKAHYDKINARHPIQDKYSGLTREQHEARLKAMRAGAARDAAHMAEVNSRPVEGSLLYNKQRASIVGTGGEGFAIKPAGQR
jgi:hypothetical protein